MAPPRLAKRRCNIHPAAPRRSPLAPAKNRCALLHERLHALLRVFGVPGDALRERFEFEACAQVRVLTVIERAFRELDRDWRAIGDFFSELVGLGKQRFGSDY